jgi:hypothetical protein
VGIPQRAWCWPRAGMGRAALVSANGRGCISRTWWRAAPIRASGCHQASHGRSPNWRTVERVFSQGKQQPPVLRQIGCAQRGRIGSSHLTTDPQTLPPESTWSLLTNREGHLRTTVGTTDGLRPWIEEGFPHATKELGWAAFRVTASASMERWGELVCCTSLLVSLQSPVLQPASTESASLQAAEVATPPDRLSDQRWWESGQGGKPS